MTCIAGVAQNGVVVIGGDSAGVSGWAMTVRADKKVFQNGEFIFGFTSSFRMGQLLRYAFDPPAHAAGALFDRDPSDRVRTALRAAERWSAGVRGPFEVISL